MVRTVKLKFLNVIIFLYFLMLGKITYSNSFRFVFLQNARSSATFLVAGSGIEPLTSGLLVLCSNQLSYPAKTFGTYMVREPNPYKAIQIRFQIELPIQYNILYKIKILITYQFKQTETF